MPGTLKRLALTVALLAGGFLLSLAAEVEEVNEKARVEELKKTVEKLRPLHKKLGKPGPRDWLTFHDEPGQTFAEYLAARPVTPRGERKVIYVQPLGRFSEEQREIVKLAADFMGRYFAGEVKIREGLPLSVVPDKARRVHPSTGEKQILAGYVLDEVLKPRLPDDAAAYIAFTASDLWPGRGWNFVFGMASLRERVGVWSIHRNGDPEKNEEAFKLCLLRTIKTATHETGHMFSLEHCTAYECNMCGSNHRDESDSRPVLACPECAAKISWACGVSPIDRYRSLAGFFEEHGFEAEKEFCEKSIKALGADIAPPVPKETK